MNNDLSNDPTAMHLAAALAEAEAIRSEAEQTLSERNEAIAILRGRMSEKEMKKNDIVVRRSETPDDDDADERDAAALALVEKDIERLGELLAVATAQRDQALAAHASAVSAEQARIADLNRFTAGIQAAELETRLHEIETTFVQGLHKLNALKKQATGFAGRQLMQTKLYQPSGPLRSYVTNGFLGEAAV